MGHGPWAGIGPDTTTTGQQPEDEWLDLHFDACRPEYEGMLRAVGLQPGWHVLDAGCGSGSYLPLMAELLGPAGRIAAYDLSPDNVAAVERRVAAGNLATPIEARVGSVLALPYADRPFDAVWFANTSQYLSDDELATALGECRRVVRPGGVVALKESDRALTYVLPAPPLTMAHLFEARARAGGVQAAGNLRGASLARWLRDAGLTNVRTRTTLVERSAPLGDAERRYWDELLAHSAPTALEYDIPAAERAFWEGLRDTAGRDRVLDDPACYCREGHVLIVGTVPEPAAASGGSAASPS